MNGIDWSALKVGNEKSTLYEGKRGFLSQSITIFWVTITMYIITNNYKIIEKVELIIG